MVATTMASTNEILHKLVELHRRSLPAFLEDVKPWVARGSEDGEMLLHSIAQDQWELADEFERLLESRRVPASCGSYPAAFTDLQDVSVDFLIEESLHQQVRNVAAIEVASDLVKGDPAAWAVCQHALGVAMAHLDRMRDYVQQPA